MAENAGKSFQLRALAAAVQSFEGDEFSTGHGKIIASLVFGDSGKQIDLGRDRAVGGRSRKMK